MSIGRKLLRGMLMRGNSVRENGLGVGSGKARTFLGNELKESQPQDPGSKNEPGAPSATL